MSQENDSPDRISLRARGRSRPPLDLAIATRLPGLWRQLTRILWPRLAPHSRLRRLALRRLMEVGHEAYNRRDFETLKTFLDESMTVYPPQGLVFDLDPVYHGRDGFVRAHQLWHEAWEGWFTRPEAVIDLGDSLLSIARVETEGAASGLPVASWSFNLYEVNDAGLVVSERIFLDREEALEAAGLRE